MAEKLYALSESDRELLRRLKAAFLKGDFTTERVKERPATLAPVPSYLAKVTAEIAACDADGNPGTGTVTLYVLDDSDLLADLEEEYDAFSLFTDAIPVDAIVIVSRESSGRLMVAEVFDGRDDYVDIVTQVCPSFGVGSGAAYITGLTVEKRRLWLARGNELGGVVCQDNPSGCCSGSGSGSSSGGGGICTAVVLDGTDDYVVTADSDGTTSPAGDDPRTVSVWFKRSGSKVTGTLFSYGSDGVTATGGKSLWLLKSAAPGNLIGLAVPAYTMPTTDFTISAWYKPTTVTADDDAVFSWSWSIGGSPSHGAAFVLDDGAGGAYVLFRNSGATLDFAAGSTPVTGVWEHVLLTVSSTGGAELFRNGVSVGYNASATNVSNNLAPMAFGGGTANTGAYMHVFDGRLTDCRVYEKVLDSTERAALYNGGCPNLADPVDAPTLYVWFTMANYAEVPATSLSVTDDSGNGNDGSAISPVAATMVTDSPCPTGGPHLQTLRLGITDTVLSVCISNYATGDCLFDSNPLDDQWHHAACVVDGADVYLYLDGVEVANGAISPNTLGGAQDRFWGRDVSGEADDYFEGLLTDGRLYDVALSAGDIAVIYNLGCPTYTDDGLTAPVLWNKFDEGTGTTAADSAAAGNDGTLTNGPTWSTTDCPCPPGGTVTIPCLPGQALPARLYARIDFGGAGCPTCSDLQGLVVQLDYNASVQQWIGTQPAPSPCANVGGPDCTTPLRIRLQGCWTILAEGSITGYLGIRNPQGASFPVTTSPVYLVFNGVYFDCGTGFPSGCSGQIIVTE
jgi:hypothetical protein